MARTQTAAPLIFRAGVIALVMVAQAALPALAFASPADPSWISGIYDDADYDDLVALATAETGSGVPVVPTVLRPRPLLWGHLLDGAGTVALVRSVSAPGPRAPPAA